MERTPKFFIRLLFCQLLLAIIALEVFAQPRLKAKSLPPKKTAPTPASVEVDPIEIEQLEEFKPKDVVVISLKETVETASRNNPDIRAANLSFDASSNTYWATNYNYFFPTGTISYLNDGTSARNSDTGSDNYTATDTLSFAASGTMPWLGLKYTLTPMSLTHTRDRLSGESYTAKPATSFELPLLQGFGPMINTIIKDQADLNLSIAKLNRNSSIVRIMNEIRTAFWDLLYSERSLEIQKNSVQSSVELVTETKTKIRNGILPELEINAALGNYYSRHSDYLKAQEDLIKAQEKFRKYLGLNEDQAAKYWYKPSSEEVKSDPQYQPLNLEQVFQRALEQRQDYVASEKSLSSLRLSARKADNQLLPDLSLLARTENTGQSVNDRSLANSRAYKGEQESIYFGVRLTWSVPNVDNRAAAQNANIDVITKEISHRQLRENIKEELSSAISSLDSAYRRVRAARLAADLSQKKLKAEATRYRLGEASQKNVIDFQREYATAKLTELEAFVNFKKAQIAMDSAMGVTGVQ